MFVQTQKTPNPNSLKFLPGKKVSNDGPYEILSKDETSNHLIRNILSINGVTGVFLGEDFLSVNKDEKEKWESIQYIVISYINEYYAEGNESVIDKSSNSSNSENIIFNSIRISLALILEDNEVKPFKSAKSTVAQSISSAIKVSPFFNLFAMEFGKILSNNSLDFFCSSFILF